MLKQNDTKDADHMNKKYTNQIFNGQYNAGKAILLSVIVLVLTVRGYAQNPTANLDAYYSMFDPQHSKTGFLFNKGFDSPGSLREYALDSTDVSSFVVGSATNWKRLYKSLQRSEVLKGKATIFPELTKTLSMYAKDEVIPIGIINVDGEYLDPELIPQYYDGNSRKLKISAPYEKVKVFAISNLKSVSRGTTVNFAIDPALYFSNAKDRVRGLQIDFGDGSGYRQLSFVKQVIRVTYGNSGEHSLRMKLVFSNGEFLSYSQITVKGSTQEKPDLTGNVTTDAGLSSRGVSGGGYEVYYGCDNVLDRPIIIVEGFDPLYDRPISDIFNDYNEAGFITNMRAFGYDVAIFKFANNHGLIQDNAQAVKALLADINTLKTGNFENILIGESMGGLVARVALAQLEASNVDHKVGLYVSYDSPHKGANIPLGIQELASDANSITFIEVLSVLIDVSASLSTITEIFDLDEDKLADLVDANNSPASRQMLIRHRDHMSGANPDYVAFQNFLNTTGYPSRSRNVALINGSNTGRQQITENGDGLLSIGEKYVSKHEDCNCCVMNWDIDAWVSPVSTTQMVSHILIKPSTAIPCVFGPATTDRKGTGTFDQKPWDIAPGSSSSAKGGSTDQDRFTFVPSVSAIDLNTSLIDGTNGLFYFNENPPSLLRGKANLIAANQTPFDDIWASGSNYHHVNVAVTNFDDIETYEIMPENMYLQDKTVDGGRNRDYKASVLLHSGMNVHPTSFGSKIVNQNNFVIASGSKVSFTAGQQIRLLPGFQASSGSTFLARIIPSNSCTVTPTGLRIANELGGEESTYEPMGPLPLIQISQTENRATFDVVNYEDDNDVPYSWTVVGENFQLASGTKRFNAMNLEPGQYTVYASVKNRTASRVFQVDKKEGQESKPRAMSETSSSTLSVYPNPSSNELVVSFRNDTESDVHIYIDDINGRFIKTLSNGSSAKTAGNYSETFDISSMPRGVYLLVVEKGFRKEVQKIVILK
ncbi:T9SS type A sorting domain-containing protein [Chryseolinea sp. T2]|uniref:T9SS type A sorting domain-containing protein n=1 Tax=Chryseolinea sp. T2 TaxID=3129255 RepID=UPI0030782A41